VSLEMLLVSRKMSYMFTVSNGLVLVILAEDETKIKGWVS
jgi:hypothetical protein